MAYTSVIPVRRLDRAVKYVMNKEKTTAVSLQDALDYVDWDCGRSLALIPGMDSFSHLPSPKEKTGDAR